MSTRSNIGIINRDGTIEMIYCQSDGYPSWNGRILLENYSNEDKVRALLALGDISSLDQEIGEQHDFDENYELAQRNHWTHAYGRDRGETDVNSRTVADLTKAVSAMEEYLYLWDCKTNTWLYSDHGKRIKPLTPKACKK